MLKFLLFFFSTFSFSVLFSQTYTITNPAIISWTPAAGETSVRVQCWGAGGGAGGGRATPQGGSGGGGGGYSESIMSVTPGIPVTIQIGTGGANGGIDVSGSHGTGTFFNSAATLFAAGGRLGLRRGGAAGLGGGNAGNLNIGSITRLGGNGAAGAAAGNTGGGGGSSPTGLANGINAVTTVGGVVALPGGNGGNGGTGSVGIAGVSPGGGGGGGGGAFAAGSGANGQMIITVIPVSYPGGVSTGLETWLRADAGVTGITPITAWANQCTTGTAVLVNGAPNLSNATTYNYNPYIDFIAPVGTLDGGLAANRQFLRLSGFTDIAGVNYRTLFWAFQLNDLTRVNTHVATVSGITTSGGPVNGTLHGHVIGAQAAFHDTGYDADFGTGAPAGTWQQNRVNATANSIHLTTKHILAASAAGSTELNCFLGGQNDLNPATSFAGHFRDWRGPVGELIGYTTQLSAVDNQKVQSYLGVKYGITLPMNYLSTSGGTIFTTLAPYNNNIIGIGRDDSEALTQKQSHNDDDVVRIYLNTVTATNALNTGTFTNNISYVMTGANTGAMCATAGSNAESPASCGLYSRIEREWKVTRANMAQSFNMSFSLAACAVPASVNIADLRLLVDDDGNFGAGTTTCYSNATNPGLFTYTNPRITVTGITTAMIPDGATRFITIGSVNVATPLPVELIEFNAQINDSRTVDLTWVTATEINNDYFEMERSSDPSEMNEIGEWQTIAIVDGAGSSNNLLNYSIIDSDPFTGNNYYRLKQVDFDGTIKYSDIRIVNNEARENYTIYPNPANSTFIVHGKDIDTKEIKLINSIGQEVVLSILGSSSDMIQFDIDTMSDGLYYVQIKTETSVIIQKLVVKR